MKKDRNKVKNHRLEKSNLEKELKICSAKLEVLLDNVSSGVAVYKARNNGEDFVFTNFNRAAEQIEQIKKEDVLGKSVVDVFPGVKEFGLFDVFQKVLKTGKPKHHPVSVYKDERITGWRDNRVHKLPSGEIIAIYDDATQNKRSELATRMGEQCFRAIANYTYDWEVWISSSGRVLWTNPAVHRVTGYTPRELCLMSDYPKTVVYEADRDRIGRAFRSALRGSTGNDVQFRIERKDGNIIWVEISWQPIFDEEGNSLGHRESIRDISERKRTEQALREIEEKYHKLVSETVHSQNSSK